MPGKGVDRSADDGFDPLGQPLDGQQPINDAGRDDGGFDPLAGLGDLGGGMGDLLGGAPAGNPGGEDQGGRGRKRPTNPYGADVVAIRAQVTPGVYQRSQAYWARRAEDAEVLTPAERLVAYLELATFQHALEDEQRAPEDQLYDWQELHMAGIRPLIQQEVQAERESIAAEAVRGARQAVLARIAAAAPQEVLNMIREMDRDG